MRYFFWLFLITIPAIAQSDFESAEKLFSAHQYGKAQPLFEQYLESHSSDLPTIERLGDINGHFKNWEQALHYYQKLKALKPSNANYHYKYGGALGMLAQTGNKIKALGMISEIQTEFETAIRLQPNHIEARWALIEFYLQLPGILGGSEAKAAAYANELLAISAVDGYLAKGHISEYFNRYELAEKQYKNAILLGGSKTTYQKLANLYKNKMNKPEMAKAVLADYQKKAEAVRANS